MKRFLAIFLLILALCAALFVTMSVSFVSKGPEAVDGVLDYRGTDFTSSVYQLDGQWEFYYGSLYAPEEFKQGTPKGRELITLPGSWAGLGYPVLGHATYRLTLQTDPGEIYLLFIPEIISSAVIWNNGTEIYRAGQVGDSAANTVTGVRNELLAVSSEDGTLELVVWAANYHLTDSGLFYPILFGRDTVMLHHLLWQRAAAAAAMGGILLIGVYHLFLYLFRRMERLYLVFSVTCVVTVLRLVMETNSMVQYFCRDGMTFFLSRVYMLLFALHSICICLFMLEAFPLRLSRLHRRMVMACFALPVLGVFLLPNTAAVAGLFLALIPNGLAAALALRSGKVGRDPYRLLYLFSLFLFIIYAPLTKTVLEAKLYIPGTVSNLFLILSQCVMLSRSYADAHEQVERVNENLERIVEERTAQLNDTNRQLSASQAALREMISNISHDLKTPLTVLNNYLELLGDDAIASKELSFSVGADCAAELLIDRHKIWSVLDNLVYNALRHTPKGGSISLNLCEAGQRAKLVVADTGEGIGAEHLPHIFQRFYKVSPERGEKDGSSGLGLYIVKNTAEAMGGTVEVDSRPGKGTVFTLTFPARVSEAQKPVLPADAAQR